MSNRYKKDVVDQILSSNLWFVITQYLAEKPNSAKCRPRLNVRLIRINASFLLYLMYNLILERRIFNFFCFLYSPDFNKKLTYGISESLH